MNETQTNLRQAEAKVSVVGILAEKDMKIEPSEVTLQNGTKVESQAIRGSLTIKVDDVNSVKFNVYANQLTKDGKQSNLFAGLQTIMNEYKSIAEVGVDAADRIAVNGGDINIFTGRDGKASVGFKSNFFNRIKNVENLEPKAEFSVELFINSLLPEYDKEQNETGRLIVNGWVPTYGGNVEPIVLIAPEGVADAVNDSFEPGQTVKFYGDVVNSKIVVTKEIPVKIGKPRVETTTKYKNELLITGASDAYEDGVSQEKPYDASAIKAAIQERTNRIEEVRNKANNSTPTPAAKPSGASRGRSLNFVM